jgi:hyperosmotically inducible periplasmic protein
MTRHLIGLTVLALAFWPTASLSESKTTDARTAMKVDEPAAPAEAGNALKDSWLTTKTKFALVTDGRVKARHIAVETRAGVITLRGKVASAAERIAAQAIAGGIDGVRAVSNALQVVPDVQRKSVDSTDSGIQKAVRARLASDEGLKDADIKVRSDNSVVTLMGRVPDAQTKTRAAEDARGVPGVRAVRNELR